MDTERARVASQVKTGLRLRRGAMTAFVERHHRDWHIAMSVLTTIYVVIAIRNDETAGSVSALLLLAFSAIFLAEFVARCWDAPSRWIYLREHWIDVVSCIPLVGWLRAFPILRLLRLGFARRYLVTLELHLRERLDSDHRQSLWFLAPCLTLLWVGSAYGIWVLEHGRNRGFSSFGDALYWSFITTTTVGYGDIRPQTGGGKIIAGLLAFLGIGLIGFASARLTAYWLQREEIDSVTTDQLRALRDEIAALRALLMAQARAGEMLHAPSDVPVATSAYDRAHEDAAPASGTALATHAHPASVNDRAHEDATSASGVLVDT